MNSSHSNSTQASQLNHPLLTDFVYNNVSQPTATRSYNGRALTRGTRGFIEYAQFCRSLPSSTNQSQTLNLANKTPSHLKNMAKDITLHLTKFLDPVERASFFQTTRFFHDLKEESLRGRSDLINKLIAHVDGDLRSLHPQDRRVLQEIGPSILSLDLSHITLSPEKLEGIVRIFPCVQELVFMYFPGVFPLPNNIDETFEACLKKLKPLKSSLSHLHFKACEFNLNTLRILSQVTRLKTLSIQEINISDGKVRLLSNFSQLESLSLLSQISNIGPPIKAETMQELGKKLKSLQTLHLNNLCSERDALSTISQFANLQDLALTNVNVMDNLHCSVIQEVGKLTKLRSLKICPNVGAAVEAATALEYLSNLTGLEKLDFRPTWNCSKESLEKFLKSLSKLTDLSLSTRCFTCSDNELFKVLASNCKALRTLCFHYFPGVGDEFHQLKALPKLERIEFKCASADLTSTIFKNLDQFPNLQKLVISECLGITLKDVEAARASEKRMPVIVFTPYPPDSESEDSEEED